MNKKWAIIWENGWHNIAEGKGCGPEPIIKCMCGYFITRLDNLRILARRLYEYN